MKFFIPTINEFILFISIVILLIIICVLYHNNNIQIIVNKISRCLRLKKMKQSSNNIYTVTIINNNKDPLYDITYDLSRKRYTTKCRMPEGNVINEIPIEIPMYDFVAKQTSANLQKMSKCSADKDYTSINLMPVSYTGYGPLIDFIESDGILTYMFDEDSGVDGARCPASVINAVTSNYSNIQLSTQVGSGDSSGTGAGSSGAGGAGGSSSGAGGAGGSSSGAGGAGGASVSTSSATITRPNFTIQKLSGYNDIVISSDNTVITYTGYHTTITILRLTVNIDIRNAVIIVITGGGGGAAGSNQGGGGGGAGTRREYSAIQFTPGKQYEIQIDIGGLGGNMTGNNSLNGQVGQSVRFNSDNDEGKVVLLSGGNGGNNTSTSCDGGKSIDNKDGGIGEINSSGGGGGSASNNGNNANRVNATVQDGGSGGSHAQAYGAGGGGGAEFQDNSQGGSGGYINVTDPRTRTKGGGDGGNKNQSGSDATQPGCGGGGGGACAATWDSTSQSTTPGGKGSNATIEIRLLP